MTQWRNWSQSVIANPATFARPRTLEELSTTLATARKARVMGAGHSFTPLCATDDTLISLSELEGAVDVSPDRATAWAPAGWSLARLTAALWDEGLALINQGDVNPQSLAGASATGTHGTGAELGSISTQAVAYRVMLADGSMVECDAQNNPDLFQAQRLSLGLIGVAVAIKVAVLPAYHLEERIDLVPFAEMVERFDAIAATSRHAEFFVFPYSDKVILKQLNPVPEEPGFRDENDMDEGAFKIACDICRAIPASVPMMQRLMMRVVGKAKRRIGPAYRIFPQARALRFEEMEYEMPRADGLAVLKDTIDYIRKRNLKVLFPLEYRTIAADDIWMSPFNNGPTAAISFHQHHAMPWQGLFREIEPVLRGTAGRPHWGKRHSLKPEDVRRLYPRTGDFLAVRARVDPEAKFVSPAMAALFGIEGA